MSGALQGGQRTRKADGGAGDGKCRKCKGTGQVRVQPEWMQQAIAASSPAKFEVPGPLMTTPQKKGPLIVPGA